MKKDHFSANLIFLIVIELFMTSCAFDEERMSYPDYYRAYSEALYRIEWNHYEIGVSRFDSLIELVPHVPVAHLSRFARISAKEGDCESAARFIRLSLENGWESSNSSPNTPDYGDCDSLITQILARESEIHQQHFHFYYKGLVDSLYEKDSRVRNPVDFLLLRATDSVNKKILLRAIQKYGFPGEKTIGTTSARHAYILLSHMDGDSDYEMIKSILYHAYNQGYLDPFGLAMLIDRRRVFSKKKLEPYYHQIFTPDRNSLSDEQKNTINLRRDSIGLELMIFE